MKQMRLQKYLAECGVASRRSSEKLILEGAVKVNGTVAKIGQSVDPDKDKVFVNGRPVHAPENKIYIALNKPKGYVCSCAQDQGSTVFDIVKIKDRLVPAGRLDRDSEGLVILTNDGELVNNITHPRNECEKEYEVTLEDDITDKQLRKLGSGVELTDGMTKSCKVSRIGANSFAIILKEGRNRQIRRMVEAVENKVKKLKRIRISKLTLADIKYGHWIYVRRSEI